MLIDLLSTSNYISFNIKVAEILGLKAAIYLAELMNINDKAIRKDKMDESSFILDRDYMAKRTTISVDEQLEIDMNLIKLGILERRDMQRDCLTIHLNILTAIMMTPDESLVGNIKKISMPKRTKKENIVNNLKAAVLTTNAELKEAYYEWIDSVIAKDGWMQKPAVTIGQKIVDSYSNHDLDVALCIVNIAAMHGYRDIKWAINVYEKDYRIGFEFQPIVSGKGLKSQSAPNSVSSEVF